MTLTDWLPTNHVEIALGALATLGTACGFIFREWLKSHESTLTRAQSRDELFVANILTQLDKTHAMVALRESRIDTLEKKLDDKNNQIEQLSASFETEQQQRFALREQYQIELSKAEEIRDIYRMVFEEGPLGITIVNQDLRFLAVNPQFCAMVQRTEQELLGLVSAEITMPDDIEKDRRQARRALRQGSGLRYVFDKRCRAPNGAVIPMHVWVLRAEWEGIPCLLSLVDCEITP